MKQRIRVVGIIRKGGDILLLKRNRGLEETVAKFELPNGKIAFGEQPEEAMARIVGEQLRTYGVSFGLLDVVTFTYLSHGSQIGNLYIIYDVKLAGEVKMGNDGRYNGYKWFSAQSLGVAEMDEASSEVLQIIGAKPVVPGFREVANTATVWVDGGSRGNPGPAAVGYYVVGVDGKVLKRGGEFIGFATSRVAEYYAVKEGAEVALELGLSSVRIVSDSLMVVNQINGIFKIKNKDLVPIYRDVRDLLAKFENFAVIHTMREDNRQADLEVNRVLDAKAREV